MGMKSNGFVGTAWALRFLYVLGEEGGARRVLANSLWTFADSGSVGCEDARCWIFERGRIGCVELGTIAELWCIWDLVGREDVVCTRSESAI